MVKMHLDTHNFSLYRKLGGYNKKKSHQEILGVISMLM